MPRDLLEVTRSGRHAFALAGELDLATADRLDDLRSEARGAETLTLDLSDLSFADTAGVAALRALAAATGSGTLTVIGTPPLVRRIASIAGWEDGRLRFDPELSLTGANR